MGLFKKESKKKEEKKVVAKAPVKKTEAKATTKKAEVKTTAKKPAVKKATPVKKTEVKKAPAKASVPKTASGMTKDVMIQKNAKTGKWSLRTTGSSKALKTFDTQAEAIEYGKLIAKNNKSEIRVKSKEGKVRHSASHRK